MITEQELNDWYKKIAKKEYLYDIFKKKSKKREINTLVNAPIELFENSDFMLKAIENNHADWTMVSDKLLSEKSFILNLIDVRYSSVYSIPEQWREDEDILLCMLKTNANVYYDLTKLDKYKDLKNNKQLAKELIALNPDIMHALYFPFKHDVEFIKKSILIKPKLIEKYKKEFTRKLFNSMDDINYILEKNPNALSYFSMKVRNIESVVKPCIKKDPSLMKYVGIKLKENEDFMLSYTGFRYYLFENLPKKLLLKPDFMEKIILQLPQYIKYVEKEIRTEDWIIGLIKKNPYVYLALDDKEKEKDLFISHFLTHESVMLEINNYKPEKTIMALPSTIIDIGFEEIKNMVLDNKIKNNELNIYNYLEQKYLKVLLEYNFKNTSIPTENKIKKLKI